MHLARNLRLATSILAPLVLADGAAAQCTSVLAADVTSVSVTAGGVQTLTLASIGPQRIFWVIGSFSGTSPAEPYFAVGGPGPAFDS